MADWILNIYYAASSSSLWAPCLPSLLNLFALTGHIVLKSAMCITSDMAGILIRCKASFTKAVSFLKIQIWSTLTAESVYNRSIKRKIQEAEKWDLIFWQKCWPLLPWLCQVFASKPFHKQGTNPNSLSNPTSHLSLFLVTGTWCRKQHFVFEGQTKSRACISGRIDGRNRVKWDSALVWDQALHISNRIYGCLSIQVASEICFSHSPSIYTVNWQQIFLCGLLK